jgi:hypothetical protein
MTRAIVDMLESLNPLVNQKAVAGRPVVLLEFPGASMTPQ